jgi:hypothetical protein
MLRPLLARHDEAAGYDVRFFADQMREQPSSTYRPELSWPFSEIIDVARPLDLAAEIEKLTAAFCPRESAERLVHDLSSAFGNLHRCFDRGVVKVGRRPQRRG